MQRSKLAERLAPDLHTLACAIAERRAILFAGAGLSMSVGLPSWSELVRHMAQELGLEASLYESSAAYQTLAEYYRLQQGSIGPLRSWMDRNWRVSEDKVRSSRLHELVVSIGFPIIYTTNYDRNIEVAFEVHGKAFVKVANARDMAKTHEDVTQVVKFHGDFDDDQSLVLTETDYFNRLAFDAPLDIKLRADAQGKTVLFVGYSMTDMNIRLLLHRLWRSWALSGYEKDRPPSYVFMARADPVQEAVLGQWGVKLLSAEADDPQDALTAFLEEIAARVRESESDVK